jgi:hypothetical protein
MTMPDDQAMYEYYADPDNRVPAGPARRRASQPLSTHVPIRFSAEVIAEVKQFADNDHKTVSSWIRDVVEAEVERRRPRWPHSISNESWTVTVSPSGGVTESSTVANSGTFQPSH